MATPKLAMIPTAYKAGKLYSVLPQSGVGDFTFARASAATRVNEDGLIETINPNFIGNELVTNGDFATDSDWTKGTGWSIEDGVATLDGTQVGGSGLGSSVMSVTSGKTYKVVVNVISKSSGFRLYDSNGVIAYGLSVGENVFYRTVTSSTYQVTPLGLSGATGSIDNISVVQVERNNIPRLDYTDGGCPNFLLEPQRTNLITYSEDFTQWATNANITPNSAISPDGTQNASLFSHSGGSFPQVALSGITFVSGADYIPSLYVKSDGTSQVQHSLLVNNVVVNFTPTNEWVRISDLIVSPDTSGSFVIAQNSGSSVAASFYIWGASLEQGSYPTSYIPTNGSTVTRVGETCNGSGDAATFNSSEGVLMAEISALATAPTRGITLGDGTSLNRIQFYYSSSNVLNGNLITNGSGQVTGFSYNGDANLFNKCALKYKVNDFAFWVNGFKIAVDTNGITPTGLNTLNFDNGTGAAPFYGKTKQIQYFDSVLTDSELETLTSWASFLEMANAQNYTII